MLVQENLRSRRGHRLSNRVFDVAVRIQADRRVKLLVLDLRSDRWLQNYNYCY